MREEIPLLIWLTKKDMNDMIFQQVELKKSDHTVPPSRRLISVYKKLMRKLEYLSEKDQVRSPGGFGKRRNKRCMITLDKLDEALVVYQKMNPDRTLEDTTLEELFFWYKKQVRNGHHILSENLTASAS